MNIAKISTFLYKKRLYDDIQFASKIQFKDVKSIKAYQEEKFLKLINHAKENVPYYKDSLENISSVDDIFKIDFLTKDKINKYNVELRAKNISPERFISNSTSGSTGESLKFYSDSENYYRKAVSIRGDGWAGLKYGNKALLFWGAERDIEKNKSIYKKIKHNFIIRNKIVSTYNMSDVDLGNFIDKINKYKPNIIVSYPTPLFHLSQFIEQNKTKFWIPKSIITSSETLFPFQKEKIERVFKRKIFNRYGSREFGHIASECEKHDGMHINIDRFVLEIINSKGENCKPGELGEIVITDLDNYVFPMIRYKIGDIGVMYDKRCSCGRNLPLLEKVEGRVFDLIEGVNGNTVAGTFWTLLRNKIKGWNKFQVVQVKKDQLKIIVEKNEDIEDDFNEKVSQLVKEKLGEEMIIDIKFIDKIPLTKTGKHRWVISKISPYVK